VSVGNGASYALATSASTTFSNPLTLNGIGGTADRVVRTAIYGAGSGGAYTLFRSHHAGGQQRRGHYKNNGLLTLSGPDWRPGGLLVEKPTSALTDLAGPIAIAGAASNNYGGSTTIYRGTVYLQKSGGAVAIPQPDDFGRGTTNPIWNTSLILNGSNQIASRP